MVASGAVFESKQSGVQVHDFIISDGIKKPITILEHNTHWFVQTTTGVLHYQIASRHYPHKDKVAEANAFIEATPQRQQEHLGLVDASSLPVPEGVVLATVIEGPDRGDATVPVETKGQ